jgi:hypothetical protein
MFAGRTMHLAGHMRHEGRVFETPALNLSMCYYSIKSKYSFASLDNSSNLNYIHIFASAFLALQIFVP